jgi:CBS domain-containing protein
MQLKEFINYRVETVRPDDTLQYAAEKMRELDVGSMPVCEDQHLVGILTDRDITIRATAKGQDPKETAVREVMTPDVLYCFENQDVEEAARIMQENQVRRLFVLNEDEELIGITSLGELATVTGDRNLAGETLRRISEPGEVKPGRTDEQEDEEAGDGEQSLGAGVAETKVTGLFQDRQAAKKAIDELKGVGFTGDTIGIAMEDETEEAKFIQETQARAVPAEIIPSLPELPERAVLVAIDADSRAAKALEVLNRHRAVTGGVRIPRE